MGIVLFISALIALILTNSPWEHAFHALLELKLGFSIHFWINDGLMVLFFALVGMEIKQELSEGELSSFKKAIFPALGAVGGMVVPALIYVAINAGGPGQVGWGIPMATDIAFAMSLVGLFASRIPSSLRVFLLSLAIVDDLGAVLVIALFYTAAVSLPYLGLSLGAVLALFLLHRFAIRSVTLWVLAGFTLWFFVLHTGVHATIAGVIFGLFAPADIFEKQLHPWVNYVVMPLFALANAGVKLNADALGVLTHHPVAVGILAGLVLGKPVGILLACGLGDFFGITERPRGASWVQVAGISTLAGIGFTMSLFVSGLAFPAAAELAAVSKMAILFASIGATLLAAMVFAFIPKIPAKAQ